MKHLIPTFSIFCAFLSASAENGKPIAKHIFSVPEQTAVDTVTKAKPAYSISSTLTNSYHWRGFVFNEGLMVQPAASVSYGKWSVGTWSNIVAMETRQNAFIPELDFNLAYALECGRLSATPQANLFFYPSNCTEVATLELGADLYYNLNDVFLYASPNVGVAGNDGAVYVEYGLHKKDQLSETWSYGATFALGWGNRTFCNFYKEPVVLETSVGTFGAAGQSMKNMRLQFAAAYAPGKRFTLNPQLTAFRNFMTGPGSDKQLVRLNGALTCSYAF